MKYVLNIKAVFELQVSSLIGSKWHPESLTGKAVYCLPRSSLFTDGHVQKEANPAPETLNELLFSDDQSLINEDEKTIQA